MKLIWKVDPWNCLLACCSLWLLSLYTSLLCLDLTCLVQYVLCVLSFQGDHADWEAELRPALDPDDECISLMACFVPHSVARRRWEFLNLAMAFPSHMWVGRPRTEKSDLQMNRKFLLRVQRVCGDQCLPKVQDEGRALRRPPQHRPQWTERPIVSEGQTVLLGP